MRQAVRTGAWCAGGQDWSVVLPDEFLRRKGYDIHPWLPYIVGKAVIGSKEESAAFRKDLVDVLTSLFAENYYGYMAELAEKSAPGMQLLVEPYGTGGQKPFQVLDIYKILRAAPKALVATEFWVRPNWGWKDMGRHEQVMRNLQKPLLVAEAFTCWPLYAWQDDPQSLKPICDRAFCTGVNRMMLHAGACNPWTQVEPGMSFGIWGTHFVPKQTWWKAGGAKAFFDYMARCQSLLQRGLPSKQQWGDTGRFKTYRRSDGDIDIVFVCNPTDTATTVTLPIAQYAGGKSIEVWNPYNLAMETFNGDKLTIEANGSRFLVITPNPIEYAQNDSLATLLVHHQQDECVATLNDSWDITFPDVGEMKRQPLFDWTQSPTPAIRYFSGTATYSTHFRLNNRQLKSSCLVLHLGNVKNMATVRVNGVAFPVMWKAPFLLDMTSALHTGDNQIEIDVTNLWPNRMIGDEQEPDDIDWSDPLIYDYAPGKPMAGRYMAAIPEWLQNGKPRPSLPYSLPDCLDLLKYGRQRDNYSTTVIIQYMNKESIDTSKMCSHLQKKLFEEDGIYHPLWIAMQDEPELTAIVRSRQLHVYRNGKKVLVLAGKAAPKIIREDRICELLPGRKEQIERIRQMEQRFNKTLAFIQEPTITPESLEAIKEDIAILDEYYGSEVWRQDLADDEAGRLPKGLKRGVLSEDGIWNLLSDYRELPNK